MSFLLWLHHLVLYAVQVCAIGVAVGLAASRLDEHHPTRATTVEKLTYSLGYFYFFVVMGLQRFAVGAITALHLILFVLFLLAFLVAILVSESSKSWFRYAWQVVRTRAFRAFVWFSLVCVFGFLFGLYGTRLQFGSQTLPPIVLAAPGMISALTWAASTTGFPPVIAAAPGKMNVSPGWANGWNAIAAVSAAVAVGIGCSGVSLSPYPPISPAPPAGHSHIITRQQFWDILN